MYRFLLMNLVLFAAAPLGWSQDVSDGPWKYVLRKPGPRWVQADFNDERWREGFGGFGERSTPGSRVGTEWTTPDIWLRRTVELKKVPAKPALLLHHDENLQVFINGTEVVSLTGYITEYKVVPLDQKAAATLKEGSNLLAVHCHQTGGGQFVDVHIIDADHVPQLPEPPRPEHPFKTELMTQWGENVTPENAWREYPRPALMRDQWTNLNGLWDYAVTDIAVTETPAQWDGDILVPFCLESKLSGVQKLLHPDQALWYHRELDLQPVSGQQTWLNFEAVDYECSVWLNGQQVGGHVGGNVPFSVDLSKAAKPGKNTLIVRVTDATGGTQLRGKQRTDPNGIWYTRVSGIWQTVWLEQRSVRHIDDLKISTDIGKSSITVKAILNGDAAQGETLQVTVRDGRNVVATATGSADGVSVTVPSAKLWSPDNPFLYDLDVALLNAGGAVVDSVKSYAGLREVGKVRDADGHLRLTLNGKEIFHWGPLDQGWWPDGLLTPPSDEALKFDVEFLKAAGFNMIRKHIKVEPRRFYTHCDRMGMMLWQDQVSAMKNPRWTRLDENPTDAEWTDAEHAQFMQEFEEMIDALENHPCIVMWVPFNEAWGQHRTMETGHWTVKRDPSRHVNIASGGNFWPVGDIVDEHRYPHPGFPFNPERYRDFVKVMGEFGGHGWPIEGHLFDNSPRNWGYGGLPKTVDEYKDRYRESIRLLKELKTQGIASGVYTQTTDVEGEINGLMTYDRRVIKISADELRKIHEGLLSPSH